MSNVEFPKSTKEFSRKLNNNDAICTFDNAISILFSSSPKIHWHFHFMNLMEISKVIIENKSRLKYIKLRISRMIIRYLCEGLIQDNEVFNSLLPQDVIIADILNRGLATAVKEAGAVVLSVDHRTPLDGAFCNGVQFLPSEHGPAKLINFDGWPGDPNWFDDHKLLRRVAVRPHCGPEDLAKVAAIEVLERHGIVFLSPNEAKAYRHGQGAKWVAQYGWPDWKEIS